MSWHRILFSYDHAGATEIWTIDPSSGAAYRQIRPNQPVHDPAVSPFGDAIAYIYTRNSPPFDTGASGMSELWLMDEDGSNPRALYVPPTGQSVLYHPVWLHNGQEIYFQQVASSERSDMLLRISVAGGEPTVVLSDCLDFALSPDGKQLLSMNLARHLFLSSQDGKDSRELVPQELTFGDYGSFAFSPEGSWLAFRGTEWDKDVWDLYSMDLSGQQVRRLTDLRSFHPFTPSSGQVTGLAWTSDGTRLVYSVDGHPEQKGIWVIDIEGGGRQRLFVPDEWVKVQGPWFE